MKDLDDLISNHSDYIQEIETKISKLRDQLTNCDNGDYRDLFDDFDPSNVNKITWFANNAENIESHMDRIRSDKCSLQEQYDAEKDRRFQIVVGTDFMNDWEECLAKIIKLGPEKPLSVMLTQSQIQSTLAYIHPTFSPSNSVGIIIVEYSVEFTLTDTFREFVMEWKSLYDGNKSILKTMIEDFRGRVADSLKSLLDQ